MEENNTVKILGTFTYDHNNQIEVYRDTKTGHVTITPPSTNVSIQGFISRQKYDQLKAEFDNLFKCYDDGIQSEKKRTHHYTRAGLL
jgi:hypothetical protein